MLQGTESNAYKYLQCNNMLVWSKSKKKRKSMSDFDETDSLIFIEFVL